ncbi:MAG: DivIVA domain-containing protein, partial [Acetomicrobium sp.]
MSEVLSALDVINKDFKRSLRGYDPIEVDDFLDLVAESLHFYAEKCGEQER